MERPTLRIRSLFALAAVAKLFEDHTHSTVFPVETDEVRALADAADSDR
jgi:hypothetical protein